MMMMVQCCAQSVCVFGVALTKKGFRIFRTMREVMHNIFEQAGVLLRCCCHGEIIGETKAFLLCVCGAVMCRF